MDRIVFMNKDFPCRELNLKYYGNVLISTTSLNSILMNNNGKYLSDEANFLDDQLFYFVENDEISLEDNRLAEIILNQL